MRVRVKDFLAMDLSGCIFKVVDARETGYLVCPVVLLAGADRNVVGSAYGSWELVGFEPSGKKTITIYVR